MKAAKFFSVVVIVFLSLFAAAFAWDSASSIKQQYAQVQAMDRELALQEGRFIQTIYGQHADDAEARDKLIEQYRNAPGGDERREVFSELMNRTRQSLGAVDPANPLARRFADESAGAINRWQLLHRRFEETTAAYNDFAQGLRGRLGRSLTGLPERIETP